MSIGSPSGFGVEGAETVYMVWAAELDLGATGALHPGTLGASVAAAGGGVPGRCSAFVGIFGIPGGPSWRWSRCGSWPPRVVTACGPIREPVTPAAGSATAATSAVATRRDHFRRVEFRGRSIPRSL